MKNINLINNQIQNNNKIFEFEKYKELIITWLKGPLCDYLYPFNFFICKIYDLNYYYLCQTTIDNDLICLNILNNELELRQLVKKQKNNLYMINLSNGQLNFNDLNKNEIYISPAITDKFFRYIP